jgi:hypothetical protein
MMSNLLDLNLIPVLCYTLSDQGDLSLEHYTPLGRAELTDTSGDTANKLLPTC